MKPPSDPKDIIDSIRKEAIFIWGSRHWLPELVREYCKVEEQATGEPTSAAARSSTVHRIFKTNKTTLQTLNWLAACVNAKIQLVAILNNEVKVFDDFSAGIRETARTLWGEDWLIYLVRQYCEAEGYVRGKIPPPKQRRNTIERALLLGTTLETATWLAAAVGAEIQMEVRRVERQRF